MIKIERLDHLVLTVADIERTARFYVDVLGMEGQEFEPKAARPAPGSADLCFIASAPIDAVVAHLQALGVIIEEGPVKRTGAISPLMSVYVRDPDGNLIEISDLQS